MNRAVIYCRVSTKDQVDNFSLATQEKACRDYCAKNGFEVDKLFVEEGESAKTANRAKLQKMLAYCRENKGRVTRVVVYAVNRFARNSHDHLATRAFLSGLPSGRHSSRFWPAVRRRASRTTTRNCANLANNLRPSS